MRISEEIVKADATIKRKQTIKNIVFIVLAIAAWYALDSLGQ